MNYWQERALSTQERLAQRSERQTQAQMRKYYKRTMEAAKRGYLDTYHAVMDSIQEGLTPTPADLYKLDRYWSFTNELHQMLYDLGDKQARLFGNGFAKLYKGVYDSLALKDDTNFNFMDMSAAEQMVQQIWCADGKSWSERIWSNTEKLQQALNDGLIECVVMGASPDQLKERLMSEFNVAYNRADSIVRTEISHIQTEAARKRYQDAGIDKVQVWASKDERRCSICGKLHEKVLFANEPMPVPAHPRCRCRIIPYFE